MSRILAFAAHVKNILAFAQITLSSLIYVFVQRLCVLVLTEHLNHVCFLVRTKQLVSLQPHQFSCIVSFICQFCVSPVAGVQQQVL
jgi:hypothetical protein